MHKKTTFLRAALCLFLVCCLLVNMSPLRVHASEVVSRVVNFSPLGIVASLILNTCGVVFSDITYNTAEALGNSLGNSLRAWGAATGLSDAVNTWLEWNSALTFREEGKLLEITEDIKLGIVKWVIDIIKGREVIQGESVAVPSGKMSYNGVILPVTYKNVNADTWPYAYIYKLGNEYCLHYLTNIPYVQFENNYIYIYSSSSGSTTRSHMKISSNGLNWTTDNFKPAKTYNPSTLMANCDSVIWSNFDILFSDGSLYFQKYEPSSTTISSVPPDAYIGDISQQVQDGTIDEEDIVLPGHIAYGPLFPDDNDDILGSLNSINQSLADGSLSHDQYLEQTVPPLALKPVITANLSTDVVTYEVGQAAQALTVSAISEDGGELSYQWYQWSPDGVLNPAINGAIASTFTPPTDSVGTIHYYCQITNTTSQGMTASVTTDRAIVEVVAKEGVGSDTATDAVTGTGLKGWLDNMLMGVSNFFDSAVTGLLEGLKGLFIPDADALIAQQTKWTDLLAERFGAVYESTEIIDGWANAFTYNGNQTSIYFPALTVNLAGVPFTFGGWYVDVIPSGFGGIIESLKLIVNIVCTFLFVNGLKKRLEGVVR